MVNAIFAQLTLSLQIKNVFVTKIIIGMMKEEFVIMLLHAHLTQLSAWMETNGNVFAIKDILGTKLLTLANIYQCVHLILQLNSTLMANGNVNVMSTTT